MKRHIYAIWCALIALALNSCSQDEPEMTATVALAGQWYVTVDLADANGNVVMEDPYGLGRMMHLTFNTSANIPTEMFVSDNGTFWDYQVRVSCDVNNLTFGNSDWAENLKSDSQVKIWNGKVVKNGGKQNNGSPADTIEYLVQFSDDEDGYVYKVSGIRYSGLVEND